MTTKWERSYSSAGRKTKPRIKTWQCGLFTVRHDHLAYRPYGLFRIFMGSEQVGTSMSPPDFYDCQKMRTERRRERARLAKVAQAEQEAAIAAELPPVLRGYRVRAIA